MFRRLKEGMKGLELLGIMIPNDSIIVIGGNYERQLDC